MAALVHCRPCACEAGGKPGVGHRTLQAEIASGQPVEADALVRVNSEARRAVSALRARTANSKPAPPSILDIAAELAAETDGVEA